MEGWPWQHSVNNTGCCYRQPRAVTIWHRGGYFYSLSLVIKKAMLLNWQDSRFTDSWLMLCPSFSAILSQIMTVSALLLHVCHCSDFLSLTPIPPNLTTYLFCCFSTFINLFLHQKLKIHVKLDKQPIWQHISFLFIYLFLSCFYFLFLNNQELWSCDRPGTRSCDRPGLHIPGGHFLLLFFCQLGMHGL